MCVHAPIPAVGIIEPLVGHARQCTHAATFPVWRLRERHNTAPGGFHWCSSARSGRRACGVTDRDRARARPTPLPPRPEPLPRRIPRTDIRNIMVQTLQHTRQCRGWVAMRCQRGASFQRSLRKKKQLGPGPRQSPRSRKKRYHHVVRVRGLEMQREPSLGGRRRRCGGETGLRVRCAPSLTVLRRGPL